MPNVEFNIYTDKDELVFSGLTDENGKIIIKDLFVGKYYIVETNTIDGYVLSDEKVYFEIKENGEVVTVYMYSKQALNDTMAELIIAKHRSGSTGRVKLMWRPNITTFLSVDNTRE